MTSLCESGKRADQLVQRANWAIRLNIQNTLLIGFLFNNCVVVNNVKSVCRRNNSILHVIVHVNLRYILWCKNWIKSFKVIGFDNLFFASQSHRLRSWIVWIHRWIALIYDSIIEIDFCGLATIAMQAQSFLQWHDNLVIAWLQHGSRRVNESFPFEAVLHKSWNRARLEHLSHYRLDDSRKISSTDDIFDEWIVRLQFAGRAIESTNNLLWWLLCVIAAGHRVINHSIEQLNIVLGDTKQCLRLINVLVDRAMRNRREDTRDTRCFEVKSSSRQRLSHSVSQSKLKLEFNSLLYNWKLVDRRKYDELECGTRFQNANDIILPSNDRDESTFSISSVAFFLLNIEFIGPPNLWITINLEQSQFQFCHSNQT